MGQTSMGWRGNGAESALRDSDSLDGSPVNSVVGLTEASLGDEKGKGPHFLTARSFGKRTIQQNQIKIQRTLSRRVCRKTCRKKNWPKQGPCFAKPASNFREQRYFGQLLRFKYSWVCAHKTNTQKTENTNMEMLMGVQQASKAHDVQTCTSEKANKKTQ